jgi:hypothetical protein
MCLPESKNSKAGQNSKARAEKVKRTKVKHAETIGSDKQ